MSAQRIDDPGRELGIFSIVLPVVWAIVGVVGFALVANWPELFAGSAQAGAAPAAIPAIARAGSDQPLPERSIELRALADPR